MNSLTAEKQYQLAKWAERIKACKSSGMMVTEWLKQNNISKDQYYYWQRKLKDACLETMEIEQATFVELPVEVPHTIEKMPAIKKATIKANTAPALEKAIPVATLKINAISLDIYDNASSQFINNLLEAFMYVK